MIDTISSITRQISYLQPNHVAQKRLYFENTKNEIRLKTAGELLRKGEYSINEVCYIVGFNNPSYFARCFRKQFGILPKEYVHRKEEES